LWPPARTVGVNVNPVWREETMSKLQSIALGVVVVLAAAVPAQADPWWGGADGADDSVSALVAPSTAQSSGQQIVLQERGRHADRRLFHPSVAPAVLIVGPPDRFDVRDAAIGGAAGIVLTLLSVAALLLSGGRRTRAGQAAPVES
jgi:hypothetical protein